MAREVKFCLVYRDMWQSSGKFMPRVDQLVKVAEPIIAMDCFARIETNGGGFEQINLLYGENPNASVRQWTQPFNNKGIQTQMLERGLNGLRMRPVPRDVRKLMFDVKKKQGTDISRSFDGLNNAENLRSSFKFARKAGMIAQGALCLTFSKLHTVKYYVELAEKLIDLGADEICLKDMAGVARPSSVGKIVAGIRKRHPKILIQYHGHSTPGFSVASSLEAARGGADIIDVGMEPLSWGTGHADLLIIQPMLKDDGFKVPDVNIEAYMETRKLTKEFIDDFLGYYINPTNRYMNSLIIAPGLPGGMMGSLMADLEKNLKSLNKWLEKRDKPKFTLEELLIKLFEEVETIWPMLGYPPLVTPYSQYVKNVALMNVIQLIKGNERWSMIDENTWGMLLGRSGRLPGPLDESIIELAKKQNRQFYYGDPQDLYPDELELFAAKMDERAWDYGLDDEELMEYAMHPQQYEDARTGAARKRFLEDLQIKKQESSGTLMVVHKGNKPAVEQQPRELDVEVNGESFRVSISYPDSSENEAGHFTTNDNGTAADNSGLESIITAPLEGKFHLTKEGGETPVKVGDVIKAGDTIAYIEAMKVINAVAADKGGTIVEIVAREGQEIEEDDIIIKLK